MAELFRTILFQPLFNLFVGLYDIIPDVGVVILLVTVFVKLVLYPMTKKSIAAQQDLQALQPKLEALKALHKDNQQLLAQETMKLYKEHKVNPLGSCLPILVQLPVFLALFYVLRDGLGPNAPFHLLYSFIQNPEVIDPISLGFINLQHASIPLAFLAAIAQFWQAKTMQAKRPPAIAGSAAKDETMAVMMNKQMLYVMPVMTLVIGFQFPGGLTLYWFLSTLLTALQQVAMARQKA